MNILYSQHRNFEFQRWVYKEAAKSAPVEGEAVEKEEGKAVSIPDDLSKTIDTKKNDTLNHIDTFFKAYKAGKIEGSTKKEEITDTALLSKIDEHKKRFDDKAKADFEGIKKDYDAAVKALADETALEETKKTEFDGRADVIINSIKEKLTIKEGGVEKADIENLGKEIAELDDSAKTAIADKILKAMDIENPVVKGLLAKEMDQLKITVDQAQKLQAEGADPLKILTEEQKDILQKIVTPKLNEYSPEKGKILGDHIAKLIDATFATAAVKKALKEHFDDDKNPFRQYLVQQYKVEEAGEGGSKKLKIDDKEITKFDEVTALLSPEAQKSFNDLLALEERGDSKALLEGLQKQGKEHTKALEDLKQIKEALANPETLQKMGLWGDALGLIQLFTELMKALQTGDWDRLKDIAMDVTAQPPRNPKERMEQAKKDYKDILEKTNPPPALADVLDSYFNIRGEKANRLFAPMEDTPADSPAQNGMYRNEIRPGIESYLQAQMGLSKLTGMEKAESGVITLAGYRQTDGEKITVEFYDKGGGMEAKLFFGDVDPAKTKPNVTINNAKLGGIKKTIENTASEKREEKKSEKYTDDDLKGKASADLTALVNKATAEKMKLMRTDEYISILVAERAEKTVADRQQKIDDAKRAFLIAHVTKPPKES